jgi:hypothetical protein
LPSLDDIQKRGLNCSPVELFNKDLAKQTKEWRKLGERIVLVMDVNNHPLNSKFYQRLQQEQTDLEEFTHKCWGPTPPYTRISGSSPINGGYKYPEIKIVNLGMLSFAESPGDHRLFIIDILTRSLLGEFRYKVCRPVSRHLVTSQQQSVDRYNKIVREQFKTHRIVKRMNAVDKMTWYCGYPSPNWLRAMIIKLYKQMTEIRVHTEKDCQKILRPESNFNPTIQMWYDRIHAYLQLIRLKEGNASNAGNIVRFAKQKHIKRPKALRMEELKDGLQFCRIRKAELQKQAKGLQKVHLGDCLLDVQSKRQNERAKAIKQKLHQEESSRMWYLIKRTVKDPHSPSFLRVQRVIKGEVKEYMVQEDVEQAIQGECEVWFSLAHSAPIMNLLLGEKLQYLSDKSLAKAIIIGPYNIPTNLDPAMAMILKEIGKLGMKIVNSNKNRIIITPEDFRRF